MSLPILMVQTHTRARTVKYTHGQKYKTTLKNEEKDIVYKF